MVAGVTLQLVLARASRIEALGDPSVRTGGAINASLAPACVKCHHAGCVIPLPPTAMSMSRRPPGGTFRSSRRIPVALQTAPATSCMVNGGPASSDTAFWWLSGVGAVMQAAA
jgi:hypothetical protein